MRTTTGRRVLALVMAVALATILAGPVGPAAAGATDPAPATGVPNGRVSPDDLANPDVYPQRGFWDVKGVTSFFAGVPNEDALLATMGIGRLDTSWARFEPTLMTPPCTGGRVEYDGHCFAVPTDVDQTIRRFTEAGLPTMAIVFGTPEWARGDKPCDPFNWWHDVFCSPADPADFGRFAGFLADRYDGTTARGRLTDFVIQNEVNMNQWYNVGCGKGIPCDLDAWVASYAGDYRAAYDAIRSHQAHAKVMIPLTHHLETSFDAPDLVHPVWSVKTFLPKVVALLGDREWSIAHHPYPRSVDPSIDARDLPHATLGNLGVLVGWLRATFPDDPQAWEIELTEQGMNNPGLYDEEHAKELCDAFRGVLGTPGIGSFIYHSLKDNPGEFGLALGLHRQDGTPKPALATWRDANDPDAPSCGFENDGHTVVRTATSRADGRTWTSSRPLPAGYHVEGRQWILSYEEEPGTAMAYECGDGDATAAPATYPGGTWLSRAADCDGAFPMGPVGWIRTAPGDGLTPIATCVSGSTRTTVEGDCPAGATATTVGWAAAEDVPQEILDELNAEDPDEPEEPEDPVDPNDPDLSGFEVVFALRDGGFRIGRLDPIALPNGDPEGEGTTYLAGDWDETTGALDLELLAPRFTTPVKTTILPDPVPTTMELSQVGGGTGYLDPQTGEMDVSITIDTRLTSPDPLFQLFLGDSCILGPTTLALDAETAFDLGAAEPRATVADAGFHFPAAHGCGNGGDLDSTLNPALGLPTSDTESTMDLAWIQGAPGRARTPTESFATAALTDLEGATPTLEDATAVALAVERRGKGPVVREVVASDAHGWTVAGALFRSILGRAPTEDEQGYWSHRMANGGTIPWLAAVLHASPEGYARGGGTDPAWVDALYADLLGRPAQAGERAYWVDQVPSIGRGLVAKRIAASPEAVRRRVGQLYVHLLGRSASAAERDYWATRADTAVIVGLVISPEYQTRAERRFP